MSDYTQIVYFAPKDALTTGNPAKKVKGTEFDAELAAIATAILSKLDSADVASNAEAAALASTSKLITPASLLYGIANGNFQTAQGFITNLPTVTPVVGDLLLIRDQSAGQLANVTVQTILDLVPAPPAAGDGATGIVAKTASEGVAASTTLQNDDHLVTGSLATGTYLFELQGGGTFNSAANGIKFAFAGGTATIRADNPADAEGFSGWMVLDSSTTVVQNNGASYPTVGIAFPVTGTPTAFTFRAWAKIVVTVAGTVQLQWAQQSATGTTTLGGGTFMTYRKVA